MAVVLQNGDKAIHRDDADNAKKKVQNINKYFSIPGYI